MSLQILEQFAAAPMPGFRCTAAGDESGDQFVAKVRHILKRPASSKAVAQIRQMLGRHAEQAIAFYERHNGFDLYRDTKSSASGIELIPVAKWKRSTEDMRSTFDYLGEDPSNDPDQILTGVAIAEVPCSGNYFVMPVEGPAAGKVFYADHDGWYESAFVGNFQKFLVHVTRKPVNLLNEQLGCYTRYSDGKTDKQWIPEEYFADVSNIQDHR
jgi:hypothetical protein